MGITNQDVVYTYIYHESDEDGFVDVSGVKIAKVLGLPIRTVQYSLKRLEDKGWIQRLQRGRYAVTDKVERSDIDGTL